MYPLGLSSALASIDVRSVSIAYTSSSPLVNTFPAIIEAKPNLGECPVLSSKTRHEKYLDIRFHYFI